MILDLVSTTSDIVVYAYTRVSHIKKKRYLCHFFLPTMPITATKSTIIINPPPNPARRLLVDSEVYETVVDDFIFVIILVTWASSADMSMFILLMTLMLNCLTLPPISSAFKTISVIYPCFTTWLIIWFIVSLETLKVVISVWLVRLVFDRPSIAPIVFSKDYATSVLDTEVFTVSRLRVLIAPSLACIVVLTSMLLCSTLPFTFLAFSDTLTELFWEVF